MKMGSIDLIVCQGSSRDIPYCQVGRDEQMRLSEGLINSEMSWNQPGEMTEQMISKVSLDQQVQLKEEEDQDGLLMIGGIGVFLPCAQEEAEIHVVDGTIAEQSQLEMTVKRKLEQTFETTEADEGKENEHSKEWLNDFSQEVEEVVALKLTVK